MISKADKTKAFILDKVAPIFNRNGYYGTSMSDITVATGLTKGAVYGNFKNKEELAFEAFKLTIERVVGKIKYELKEIESPAEQLEGLFNFYKKYKQYTIDIGGCPIVNIGVDANHQHPELLTKVQEVVNKLQHYIQRMIENGIDQGEIHADKNPHLYAKRFFAMIEGAIFMTVTMNDDSYMNEMMEYAKSTLKTELLK